MANEIQTAPSTTLADNDDWEQELNLRELSMKGYDGISLTEWAAGDTDRPQIAAGSVIEIDGAIAKFTNQTAIADEGGIADGWCYVKFVVSGADVTPTLTNTFGTWDTAKQGFYSGNDRYALFAMCRSGAVTKIYTNKSIIDYKYATLGKIRVTHNYTGTTNASTVAIIDPSPADELLAVNVYGTVDLGTGVYRGVDSWLASGLTNILSVSFGTSSGACSYDVYVVSEIII